MTPASPRKDVQCRLFNKDGSFQRTLRYRGPDLDPAGDDADGQAFLARSENDPHQFRFIVSAEDSERLADLRPVIRDLMQQMERDLGTKLDWIG